MKPKIMAVGGGSGSGKTTLVSRLRKIADPESILVLHMDHYYKDLSHLTPAQRDLRNFDHPEAFDLELLYEQLGELHAGRQIERPTYNFASHTRTGEAVLLQPKPVVILDGILSLHDPQVRQLLSLGIYVDCDDDVRFIRRLRRDISERGRTMESVITQYMATVKSMHDAYVAPQKHTADIIVSWMDYNDHAVEMLAGLVRSWFRP